MLIVKTLKKVIRQLALMGLNTLMLYCEDSFEVPEQPYFGYMRARYWESDMRELDEYAYQLGVEMIPCIQTLAHMPDALRWRVFSDIKDYDACLLVGKERTYTYIRDLITAASRPFRTKKIHIGMDEAWQLGRGHYIDEFGYRDPSLIMKEHLERVNAILNELGLEPMMRCSAKMGSNEEDSERLVGHVASPSALSRILLVGGDLLVPCSLPGCVVK